jgi:hypothetical protein
LKKNGFHSKGILRTFFEKVLPKDEPALFYKETITTPLAPEVTTISYTKENLLKKFNEGYHLNTDLQLTISQ